MNEFFASLRADLTDRRLLPIEALVAVLLVAAIAYAALGGSGGSSAPAAGGGPVATPTPGIAVTGATPEHAIAETTDGFKEQASGKARNPFAALPGTATPKTTSSSASSASSSSAASGTTSSGAGSQGSAAPGTSGGATPEPSGKAPASEGKKHSSKPKIVYDVAIEFGVLPPGTTPENAQLTPFTKLKLQTLLPSSKLPLLAFRGVTAGGKTATFQLVSEAILSGTGHCLPSETQCEAVDLKPGQTEQLSYTDPEGTTTVYELRVLTIVQARPTAKASKAAKAAKASKTGGWAESKAGRELLAASGLEALPFMRYSSQPGVLVFVPHKAKAALAYTALVTATG